MAWPTPPTGFGGGWTRDQTLTIFRDSRIGSYGGAALVLSLLLRWALLACAVAGPGVLAHRCWRRMCFAAGRLFRSVDFLPPARVPRAKTVTLMGKARASLDSPAHRDADNRGTLFAFTCAALADALDAVSLQSIVSYAA